MVPPRLLVSVRNSTEAQAAISAGAEIIDVKEPRHGSLGKADDHQIAEVIQTVAGFSSRAAPIVSAAWGELHELPGFPGICSLPGLSFVKLGLSGFRSNGDWRCRWERAQEQLRAQFQHPSEAPGWIAVAYVDDQQAGSPPVAEIVQSAIQSRCSGVLFDTYCKSSGTLSTLVSKSLLAEWCQELRDAGLLSVAAGKVQLADISWLKEIGADVVAVRSAACRNQNREAEIDPLAIRRLLQEMRETSTSRSPA